jgi:Arc/MetJ-type ribon-helix-helix transcriptional regulator
MAKQKVVIRSARFDHEFNKKIDHAIVEGGFSSASAFMRSAVERELAGRDGGLHEAEDRIAASLDRVAREIRSVRLGQQALFAFVDALVKTLLTCLAEPPKDAYDQAVARGKFRYDRFLKSVGAGMVGDSQVAMKELVNRGEEP